jgi:uncharacterized RDD family membrane protein YckC
MSDPSGAETPPQASAAVLAGLPRRLAAIVYDSLLLGGILFAATLLALALVVAVIGVEAFEARDPLSGNPFFRGYLLLICFFFYGGFWIHGGQTLGMRAWRLRVQRRDGRGIGWWQALARFMIAGLWLAPVVFLHRAFEAGLGPSLAAGFGGLLLLLVLRLPDRLSETELVVLPGKS